MTADAKAKVESASKAETLRETYDRLKPKWKSGRVKNFKRWALVYRREQQRKKSRAQERAKA